MSDLKAFRCPNCQEFINNLMTSCKYCSIPLDVQTLSSAVGNQDTVNNAYNAASNVRILAGVMVTFYFLSFIPFMGLLFSIAHYITFFGVPLLLLFWLIRYGSSKTTDPEYKEAKKYCWTALFIWLGFIAIRVILILLFFGGMMALSGGR
jgi:uncharacterized Tic20 family protein